MPSEEFQNLMRQIPKLTPIERIRLQEVIHNSSADPATSRPMTEAEFADYLASIGVITRSRRRGHKPFPNFAPIPVSGRPLSEDILEDRGPR